MTLEEAISQVKPLDEEKMKIAKKRWDNIAKPLHSLGKMEDIITQIVGITGQEKADISKKVLVAMCADNGVVEEGVTQTGQEVTAIVADNFVNETTTACVMCHQCGVDIMPVDVGMVTDTTARRDFKVAYGTKNMTKGPAMTREEAVKAIEAGINVVKELKEKGYQMLATGEMGIGNTTTSSAVASVLLKQPVEAMTGRGAGLTSEGLVRKINAIKKAIELNQPDPQDAIDVLAKVGGFDIGGMAGVFLGGAAFGMPVLMDGFISCVSALIAKMICPMAGDYMIASHVSKEPAAHLILEHMGKDPVLHADMCLGEGTGAIALCPFIDMGATLYNTLSTFEDINVDQYEELK
ncbi:nicotinate-nucleotide--dimethylbenzimidazole phosphoribosyltransferase [Ruminococcus sp. 5_1_39BFAA]|uniref:nicotinate-nucleotide--dimethylbenzimidazole phosphoribosyltransferase n=1 Tax=Ruminococcus sp. 5_1_39BFAA TaxID=457412 RepID=UPI00356227E6